MFPMTTSAICYNNNRSYYTESRKTPLNPSELPRVLGAISKLLALSNQLSKVQRYSIYYHVKYIKAATVYIWKAGAKNQEKKTDHPSKELRLNFLVNFLSIKQLTLSALHVYGIITMSYFCEICSDQILYVLQLL